MSERIESKIVASLNYDEFESIIYLTDLKGIMKLLHKYIYKFTFSDKFQFFIILVIFFNAIVLGMDGLANASPKFNVTTNIVFTSIFIAEMSL